MWECRFIAFVYGETIYILFNLISALLILIVESTSTNFGNERGLFRSRPKRNNYRARRDEKFREKKGRNEINNFLL